MKKNFILKKYVVLIVAAVFFCLFSLCSRYYISYNGDIGFSELLLAENKIEVTYIGPRRFNATQAKKYALIRAGQIAQQKGFSYVSVLSSQVNTQQSTHVKQGKTEIIESTDSSGLKKLGFTQTPAYTEVIYQPSITLTCQMTTDSLSESMSIKAIMNIAKEEEITFE